MAGAIVGLDMREALASLPPALDRDFARRLFTIAELHYVSAVHERDASRRPDANKAQP